MWHPGSLLHNTTLGCTCWLLVLLHCRKATFKVGHLATRGHLDKRHVGSHKVDFFQTLGLANACKC